MKLATTTCDFDRFSETYEEKVANVCEAGFKYIDFSMYVVDKNDEFLVSNNWCDNAKRLLESTQKKAAFVQAHSPSGNPLSENQTLVDEHTEKTIRSIDVCGILEIPNIVVHAGMLKCLSKEESLKETENFFENFSMQWKETT